MRYTTSLLSVILMIMAWTAHAQRTGLESASPVSVISTEEIFSRGTLNVNLNQILDLKVGTVKYNGEKYGNRIMLNTRVEANYFFVDNVGVGIQFGYDADRTSYNTLDPARIEKVEVIRGGANILYGNRIRDAVNIITTASVGFQQEKTYRDDIYGGNYEQTDPMLFLELTTGVPLKINPHTYFTPYIGYQYIHTFQEDYNVNQNGILFGFNFDHFINRPLDTFPFGWDRAPLTDRYRQGQVELGSNFFGQAVFGGQTTVDSNWSSDKFRDGIGNAILNGTGLYYLVDNLAAGLTIDYACRKQKSKDNDYTWRESRFIIEPLVKYHLPVQNAFSNFYVEAACGFGKSLNVTNYGSGESKQKQSLFSWHAGIGYNIFLTGQFSVSPFLNYASITSKDKEYDDKEVFQGFDFGVRANFRLNPRFRF